MKLYPPQPEWLRNMTCGLEKGYTYRLLIDGVRFAVVQMPGRRYMSGQTSAYGSTSYELVDKQGDPRNGVGIMRCSRELKDGGRIGKKILAQWKQLVEASDKAGTFVTEIAVSGCSPLVCEQGEKSENAG